MDAHDDRTMAPGKTSTPDLAGVQRVYELMDAGDVLPGIEELLTFSHEEIQFRPYAGAGSGSFGAGQHELLRGPDAIREFFRTALATGYKPQPRARSFEVSGDSVVVRGSIRLTRPDGSFAETKVSWNYHFRDGLVDQVAWEPRAGH
jgi:ketosteroid isomerase-like protein